MAEEYRRYAPNAAEYNSLFPAAMLRRMRAEYEEADYIVVPSSVVRDTFVEHNVPSHRILEVPFGVDTRYFAHVPHVASQQFRVAFLGRLELLKGVHYLLEAWRIAALRNSRLSLAGPVLPEMQEVLSNARLGADIAITGQLGRAAARRLLVDSDVVVFPSICDAFGLVILEAMATGRPVVATVRSGAPDIIDDGVDGFIVPDRDPSAIAERLKWLSLHRAECEEMGVRARRKVEESYDLRHYGERLIQAYARMITMRGQVCHTEMRSKQVVDGEHPPC
jgi:glycosyltransferase involved in cell wall biosynthesis